MKYFSVSFCLLILFLLIACGNGSTPAPVQPVSTQPPAIQTPKPPPALQPTAVSSALFQVIKPDGTSVGVTIADIKTLPLKQITVEGKVQEGPGLLDVLHFAGVTDFKEVDLTGSSSQVTLTRELVDDNTILDLTNHGTVKLATTYVPKANWTKDVSQIVVK